MSKVSEVLTRPATVTDFVVSLNTYSCDKICYLKVLGNGRSKNLCPTYLHIIVFTEVVSSYCGHI